VKIYPKEFLENLLDKRPELKKDPRIIKFKKSLEEKDKLEL
jgi:hypothetical protein